jgi:hypothetical protein
MTPILSWLAKSATYLQRPWVIGITSATIASLIALLFSIIRYSRVTNIALRTIGFLFLACCGGLVYAKFGVPAVKVPSTALVWMAAIGIAFLVTASILRRQRVRTVHG